jgi:16S rRNA (cytosine967-C5)-methyltransferase
VRLEKPRQIALRVFERFRSSPDYIERHLEDALESAGLSVPDRALCRELVCGIVRWQATLDWLISRRTDGRSQPAGLQDLLRLGLYQMMWLDRIPAHAAVNETVEMAKQAGFGQQTGFLNAVLRGYARQQTATRGLLEDLKTREPALGHSHPGWLWERWKSRWGADAAARLMAWNNIPPRTCVRINRLRADTARVIEQWRTEKVEFEPIRQSWIEENQAFEIKSHPSLESLPSFQQGGFYVQDPSTLLAVAELAPQKGEAILDLCAAPGGKSMLIAEKMGNCGRVVAHDPDPRRLALVTENARRLGVECIEAISTLPATGNEASRFDRVLVDAPCSNTGVMRRRADLRWRIRPEEIDRLAETQIQLLRKAAARVRSGGLLVFSTCSIEKEENQDLVQRFLAESPAMTLEGERQILPWIEGVDGAYVARLRQSGKPMGAE